MLPINMIGFWKWGFRASIDVKNEKAHSPVLNSTTTLNTLISELPILKDRKLWLSPLLFNGTLQTINYATAKAEKHSVFYGREIFTYSDNGICSLDWIIPAESKEEFSKLYEQTLPENWPRLHPRTRFFTKEELAARTEKGQSDSTRPICVVFHGLAGGSHEPLIRNLADDLTSNQGNEWDLVVVNSRGCCRTKITLGKLFSAFSQEDVGEVLEDLKLRYPNRPLYTIGFSFGAAILTNYLGFQAERSRELVEGAVLIGCPWDMAVSARHLENSLSGRYLFNPQLTLFLNKLVKANYAELTQHHPEIFNKDSVNQAWKAKRTWQWDDIFTCKTVGFKDSWAYYAAASPILRAGDIRVPTLIINSTDDPAVAPIFPDTSKNPYLALIETNLGGHLGWAKYSGEFWCVEVADEFMNLLNKAHFEKKQ
ncbi:hypothetical protein PUMCH_003318 [Australozyma saopauloensis]|uniref:AB hydrolase-1 domain-containing protein n=1 Tax=Australozyma saopauloensis TaxID=291208 RepID=A0AAX4HBV1_9ASCO|nr:hypothetical protein PUMCH_003318 [[Candida] saopauloensis]